MFGNSYLIDVYSASICFGVANIFPSYISNVFVYVFDSYEDSITTLKYASMFIKEDFCFVLVLINYRKKIKCIKRFQYTQYNYRQFYSDLHLRPPHFAKPMKDKEYV